MLILAYGGPVPRVKTSQIGVSELRSRRLPKRVYQA